MGGGTYVGWQWLYCGLAVTVLWPGMGSNAQKSIRQSPSLHLKFCVINSPSPHLRATATVSYGVAWPNRLTDRKGRSKSCVHATDNKEPGGSGMNLPSQRRSSNRKPSKNNTKTKKKIQTKKEKKTNKQVTRGHDIVSDR